MACGHAESLYGWSIIMPVLGIIPLNFFIQLPSYTCVGSSVKSTLCLYEPLTMSSVAAY